MEDLGKKKDIWTDFDKTGIFNTTNGSENFLVYRPALIIACKKCKKVMYEHEAATHFCVRSASFLG